MQTLAANSNNYAVSCHDQGNKYFNRNPQKRNRATIETWARKPKHLPHVVGLAQNHSSFGVTRCADFTKSRFATRALQAIYMPVLIESMKQEAIHDFFSASGTRFHPSLILSACWMNEKQRSVQKVETHPRASTRTFRRCSSRRPVLRKRNALVSIRYGAVKHSVNKNKPLKIKIPFSLYSSITKLRVRGGDVV